MKKQIFSILLMVLIVSGIVLSVLNFCTKAYAGGGFGTNTRVTSILLQSIYTNQGKNLYGDHYCIDNPSDCCIVLAN
ncbi:MAG: hypothetical protein JXB26_18420 [Candidatus Aminicenantes bacterium]|nr:hypothetical protein [Candidatus Aminicenantes bacterium]